MLASSAPLISAETQGGTTHADIQEIHTEQSGREERSRRKQKHSGIRTRSKLAQDASRSERKRASQKEPSGYTYDHSTRHKRDFKRRFAMRRPCCRPLRTLGRFSQPASRKTQEECDGQENERGKQP